MKILAIDTSSAICSVALLIEDKVISVDKKLPLQQAQHILPMINELLCSNEIELKQLNALAFGCGPGSFTGIRIATSVIQGLGFGLNKPIIPISSLAALAQAAYHDLGWKKLLVGIDARIQEVYWGAYQVGEHGLVSLIGKEIVIKPEELLFPESFDWYGVGDAWDIYRNQIHFQPLAIDMNRFPLALGVLELAKSFYLRKEWVSAAEALPVYVRDNVAKKSTQ
jgi:tRNA threonylcarbamoyladenosine biosynthesis protein TsaB